MMRLWSVHPGYLDSKGLVALWREALLAKAVLESKTYGYKKHPQLSRFKKTSNPLKFINAYLQCVYEESVARGYKFDVTKFCAVQEIERLPVTAGQIRFEFDRLMSKLKKRDPERFERFKGTKKVEVHPLFYVIDGVVEDWEKPG